MIKKRLAFILACLVFLLGCQSSLYEASSLSASALAAPQEVVVSSQNTAISPTLEACDIAPIQSLEVYRFWENGKIYTHETIAFTGEQTVLSVVNAAASVLPFVNGVLPIQKITREKAFVTVDFHEDMIVRYAKSELYEVLTTISMTLLQNGIADSIRFTLSGEVGPFGEQYQPEALAFAEGDPAVFTQIRAAINYPGMTAPSLPTDQELSKKFGITMDPAAWEIMTLLTRVGKIEGNAESPQQLDFYRLYYHCIGATPYVSTDKQDAQYVPELVPIADSVSAKLGMTETMFWIGEHLQQTAKALFGDDFILDLSQGEGKSYSYFPQEGVVTPPHMGGGYRVIPLIRSYEKTTDGYLAEVVYLYENMGGGIAEWGSETMLSDAELADYVEAADPARVVMRRATDGRLCFVSYYKE